MSAIEALLPPESYTLLKPPSTWSSSSPEISLKDLLPEPNAKILQIMPYESIDFEYAAMREDTCLINSYMIRKALTRKHFLSATVDNWVAKHPDSVLKTHVKRSEAFEVDYAEFLDDALVEAWDLRESMEKNACLAAAASGHGEDGDEHAESVAEQGDEGVPAGPDAAAVAESNDKTEWWILKPSMSDRGQGIRLFSTMEQLQEIFDDWEVESDEDEDEDEQDQDEEQEDNGDDDDKTHITTSHLRHFVAQPYIHPPLLLPSLGNRKFHIRVYVLALGSLSVYVYRDMLALFAGKPYQPPSFDSAASNLDAHLTNTCLQTSSESTPVENEPAFAFWSLPTSDLSTALKESIFAQICAVTGELFEAAARAMTIHFQPMPQAFEVYGLDYLVDAAGKPWLLEVNAFPDFKQTGERLTGVVGGFWRGVVKRAVLEGLKGVEGGKGKGGEDGEEDGMVLARKVDLGRRW